jgi:HlyD family secretion protein
MIDAAPIRLRALGGSLALLALAACGPAPQPGWSGYAEGDYVYVAAPLAGRLDQLAVQAGDAVKAGAALFTLDDEAERAAQAQASAQLDAARAQAANVQTGRRPQEIAVIRAQLAQAQAQAALAQQELARRQTLTRRRRLGQRAGRRPHQRGADPRPRERAAGQPEHRRAAARPDERAAAQAQAQAASAALRQSEWRREQKRQARAGRCQVADTFSAPASTWARASRCCRCCRRRASRRAFVPEAEVGRIKTGERCS